MINHMLMMGLRFRRHFTAACLFVLFVPGFGYGQYGQDYQGTFEIHGFGGTFVFDDSIGLENSILFGVRGAYNITERFAIEGTFGLTPTEDTAKTANVNVFITDGSLVVNFPSRQTALIPFLLAGVGFVHFDVENANNITNEFSLQFGGGVKYFFSERGFVRVEVRDTFIPEKDLLANNAESLNNFQITGGISFQFGR